MTSLVFRELKECTFLIFFLLAADNKKVSVSVFWNTEKKILSLHRVAVAYYQGALFFLFFFDSVSLMWFLLSLHSGDDLLWEESPFARRALELCQDLSHLTGSEWRVINKGAAAICWCVVNLCDFPFLTAVMMSQTNCAGHSMFNRTESMQYFPFTFIISCGLFVKVHFKETSQGELTFRAPHFCLFVLGTSYIKCNIYFDCIFLNSNLTKLLDLIWSFRLCSINCLMKHKHWYITVVQMSRDHRMVMTLLHGNSG